MERSKLTIALIVVIAAFVIVWRVGFYKPAGTSTEKAAKPKLVSELNKVAPPAFLRKQEGGKPSEANEPKGAAGEKVVALDVNQPQSLVERGAWSVERGANRKKLDAKRYPLNADKGMPFDPNRSGPPSQMGFDMPMGTPSLVARGPSLVGPELTAEGPNAFAMLPRPDEMRRAFEPNRPAGPNEPMEALNLREVEMKSIIQKLAEWTGKVVIPTEEAMKQKVTIYSSEKLPRGQALAHIYSALRMKGYVVEHGDNAIYITPMKDAKLGFVPTITAGQPLALLENKDQIVQKFFKLGSYRPTQMSQVIQPLVGEYGYVSADETTSTLLVIDTVQNLMRIERIIVEFDVPEAEQSETNIFPVQYGDPSEIVQMLKILLGQSQGYSASRGRGGSERDRFGGPPSAQVSSQPSGGSQQTKTDSSKSAGAATSVVVTSTRGSIVLIPEPRRKWIIARASAEDMKLIDEWIKKLDRAGPVESEYEVVQLRYADAEEVERSIEEGFRNLPGTEFLPSINVEPLRGTRQVVVFGRKDLREMVKKIIAEMDIPPGQFETQYFKLKYADPDQIKTNIDDLYQEGTYSSGRSSFNPFSPFGYSSGRRSSTTSTDMVKVLSYVSLKQITVIASPENMEKIRQQIAEWDRALDVNEVRPRIIELRNSDPVKMAALLTTLFSEQTSTGRTSFFEMMFGGSQGKQKIVGPLYGQLTFEEVSGTKKIIVISKIPEAYDVVEALVRDLDKQEMAEVPRVIKLKYANPEDLCERLNAMFNEPGSSARIRFSTRGLSEYSMDQGGTSSSSSSSNTNTSASSSTDYTPWWSGQGARSNIGQEMPISNIIGRIRFVPDPHTKAILTLAPPEFIGSIEKLIQDLDVPGKQVMIKAIIVEIDHSSVTSLGLQLSSNPLDAFGTLEENAVTALNQLTLLEQHGSFTLDVEADVTALVDFLVKKTNAKILNQQTLWTKDNEEANFFKGDKVAFQTQTSLSETGGRATSSYEFQRVGMTLRSRPSITPEKNVDMIVNVMLSQLTGETVNGQPVRTEMETTTNMIVQDGQTIMLGGILFQKDSVIERKIPLFGDVPVVGGLFRHNETMQGNNELIVFITPYVVDEPNNILPETKEQIEKPQEKLKEVQKQLEATMEALKED